MLINNYNLNLSSSLLSMRSPYHNNLWQYFDDNNNVLIDSKYLKRLR